MSSAPTPGTRICSECGHPNGGNSLFCADCGASLAHATVEDSDSQTTTTFTPVSTGQETATWNGAQDPYATGEFHPQTDTGPSSSSTAWQDSAPAWQEPVDTSAASRFYEPESRRGLVLGTIASLLIVLVIGFFVWSTLLSQSARDSLTGLF